MATLTIKNIPDELYDKLKEVAKDNRRSINNEVIHIIDRTISFQKPDVETILAKVRILREQLDIYVTEEELNQAKNEGRP